MALPLSENPSSSINRSSTRTDRSDRTDRGEERAIEEESLRRVIPPDFWPPGWCRHYDEPALVSLLEETFGFPLPDAVDLLNRFGLTACQGAALRTLTYMAGGMIRRPRGWLITTLKQGREWTSAQVDLYIDHEWEKALARLETSDDETYRRLAREYRLARGEAPENVVRLAAP